MWRWARFLITMPPMDGCSSQPPGVLIKTLAVTLLCAALTACPSDPGRGSNLPKEVAESSGIIKSRRFADAYWTHSDKGSGNVLYAFGSSGALIRQLSLVGGKNIDWEDIAVDDAGDLYVGDIGNNDDDRQDLLVYRFAEPDPRGSGTAEVARRIRFWYPGQRDAPDDEALNHDAEALFWAQGSLYLLTKDEDTTTRLFRFPTTDPSDKVDLIDNGSYNVGLTPDYDPGRVTAADADPESGVLALLTLHAVFLFERPAQGDRYLDGEPRRIDLDMDVVKQCEGIAWSGSSLLITNESGEMHWIDDALDETTTRYP